MSIRVMSEVWRLKLGTSEKMVLLKLADCADDEGRNAWPSVKRIAHECGMSPRTVLRALKELRSATLITEQKRATAQRPTVYEIHTENGERISGERRARAHASKAGAVSAAVRLRVFTRDKFKCQTCGKSENLTIDHVDPDAGHGDANLQTLCRACNARKGRRAILSRVPDASTSDTEDARPLTNAAGRPVTTRTRTPDTVSPDPSLTHPETRPKKHPDPPNPPLSRGEAAERAKNGSRRRRDVEALNEERAGIPVEEQIAETRARLFPHRRTA